jgi:hypothetical protein
LGGFIVWFLVACLNLFRVGAFLNCGLNLFYNLIEEGEQEFANNCNLVSGFLNSVWLRNLIHFPLVSKAVNSHINIMDYHYYVFCKTSLIFY